VLLVALLLASLAPLTARAEAMRCGMQLVKDDTPLERVLSICGKPSAHVHRIEHVTRTDVRKGSASTYTVDVVVDGLTYDFGPTAFVYYLTFHDGAMVSMIKGSWGASR
jgi:hypothetical protein